MIDQEEFTGIFSRCQQKMYMKSRSILISHDEAVDAVQDVMAKLWEKRVELQHVKNYEAYAMQMVKNHSYDRVRSAQARELPLTYDREDDGAENAEDQLERETEIGTLREVLAAMSGKNRRLIELRDLQEYDYEAMAREMDMKPGAIRTALSRARTELKKELKKKMKPHHG